jgi:hypothetical protein
MCIHTYDTYIRMYVYTHTHTNIHTMPRVHYSTNCPTPHVALHHTYTVHHTLRQPSSTHELTSACVYVRARAPRLSVCACRPPIPYTDDELLGMFKVALLQHQKTSSQPPPPSPPQPPWPQQQPAQVDHTNLALISMLQDVRGGGLGQDSSSRGGAGGAETGGTGGAGTGAGAGWGPEGARGGGGGGGRGASSSVLPRGRSAGSQCAGDDDPGRIRGGCDGLGRTGRGVDGFGRSSGEGDGLGRTSGGCDGFVRAIGEGGESLSTSGGSGGEEVGGGRAWRRGGKEGSGEGEREREREGEKRREREGGREGGREGEGGRERGGGGGGADYGKVKVAMCFLEGEQEDLIVQRQQLSLICPLSCKRISIPVKGQACTHMQCFDKDTWYLYAASISASAAARKAPRDTDTRHDVVCLARGGAGGGGDKVDAGRRCPLCNREISLLVQDSKFTQLLQKCSPHMEAVQVDAN